MAYKSMSFRTCFSFSMAAVLLCTPTLLHAETGPLGIYKHNDGSKFFSLSLSADLPAQNNAGRNIVVLFDTSASQVGPYRETGIAALQGMLGKLGAEDRVQLMAADLDAHALTSRFSTAGSPDLARAIDKLRAIAPLGTTDMKLALEKATGLLEQSGATNRVVVYIGDGVSTANILQGESLKQIVGKLRKAKVSVNSYAIGPKQNAELLAAIANQSGGNLYIDDPMAMPNAAEGVTLERAAEENRRRGEVIGRTLAAWAQAKVAWPESANLGQAVASVYPTQLPPLRSDRDSIVVGRLTEDAQEVSIQASVAGKSIEWSSGVTQPSEDNAFLVDLVDRAEKDSGASLPTVGTSGLKEVARMLNQNVDSMTAVAEKAVASGDAKGAKKIADAVLRRDPGNLRAQNVKRLASKKARKPAANKDDIALIRVAQAEPVAAPRPAVGDFVEGPMVLFDESGLPPAETVRNNDLLTAVEKQNRVMAQQLDKEVQVAISEARDRMSRSPEQAIQDLKLMLESVKNAPELIAGVRASLIDRLESTIRQAARSAEVKEDVDREREEAIAAARERRLLLDRLAQEREREKQLMDQFNALMDEGQYAQAEEVADIVDDIDENSVTPVAAKLWVTHKRYHQHNQDLRELKARKWIEALSLAEESSVPFPDSPPIVFPDAEFWRYITARREQYKSVSISGESESERKINKALSSSLTANGLDFSEVPLEEVVEFLRTEYGIEIQLDATALEDLGIGSDELVTVNLRNISLRSALRLMLKQMELTYIIRDEVLLITTQDEADQYLTVRAYYVGDLVIDKTPLPSIGGGGGFGGGGGGGGQFGGGGGGGFGGGGGGGQFGGGGGGAFSVPETGDSLVLTKSGSQSTARSATPATARPAAPTKKAHAAAPIKVDTSVPADQFWGEYFSTGIRPEGPVRATVRRLAKKRQHDQVIALIQAALRNGQPQSWMYEALGLSMQMAGKSPHEVERAIMSAVDFSSSASDLMLIAHYLTKLNLDSRAVQVLRQVVKLDPQRHEAYIIGLRAAERTEDVDSLRWATTGVLSQAWPKEQQAIAKSAARLAKMTLRRLEEAGRMDELAVFRKEMAEAMVRDCVIRVTWTGDADIDLIVEEPDGSICSLSQPRSTGGGVILGDAFASNAGPGLSGFSETYVCPKGFSGDYQARLRRVWGDVTAGTVTVDVYTNYRGPDQQHQRGQIALKKGDSAVRFALADGRRSERLDQQQLAHAINRQEAISKAVLAQQIGSLSDPGVTSIRPDDRERIRRRRLAGGRGGAVGFQPQITILPDGTQFSVNAVTSADRRYVIVRPSPSFTSISDVSTFTFSGGSRNTNDDNNDNDDDDDDGGLIGRRGQNGRNNDDNNNNGNNNN